MEPRCVAAVSRSHLDPHTQAFLKKEGGQVTRKARAAKKALEGAEGKVLEAAEAEGLSHARS